MFLKRTRYEDLNHLEQIKNQRLNIQYMLESYEMIITYIFLMGGGLASTFASLKKKSL